jgi:hypothetical protein
VTEASPSVDSSAAGPPPGGPPPGGSPPGRGRILILIGVVVAIVVVAVAASSLLGGARRQTETGIVVAVQATSLANVEGFSIRTGDGRTVDFRITSLENAAAFPPGHLSVHKVSLAPIVVTYVADGGTNRAVRIEDAP